MIKAYSKLIFLISLFLFTNEGFAADHFLLDVPLEDQTGSELIKAAFENRHNLPDSFKLETQNEPSNPLDFHGVSCWIWIERALARDLVSAENRIECRWIYGNFEGLGVLSLRLSEELISPVGGSNALNILIEGKVAQVLTTYLQNRLEEMLQNRVAEKVVQDGETHIRLLQEENRFPQLSCSLDSKKCLINFHVKTGEEDVSIALGASSLDFAKAILTDVELLSLLEWGPDKKAINENDLQDANCIFTGKKPLRGTFIGQYKSMITCDLKTIDRKEINFSLDLSPSATQRWGSQWQGFDAVMLMGSRTKMLYQALRRYTARVNSPHIFYKDWTLGNTWHEVSLVRKHLEKGEYPEVSLECAHEIYRDPFTELYKKYFPKTYLGRIEYYKCLFKGEKKATK